MRKQASFPRPFSQSPLHYVLDQRSLLYWEPVSSFFFDPSSQLYIDANSAVYYRYNSFTTSFQAYTPPLPTIATRAVGAGGEASVAQPASAAPTGIAFGLSKAKKAALPKSMRVVHAAFESTASANCLVDAEGALLHRRKAQRAAGLLPRGTSRGVDVSAGRRNTVRFQHSTLTPECEKKKRMAHKCWTCRRGFASAAKLMRHERNSALHKRNLAARAKDVGGESLVAAGAAAVHAQPPPPRDRAGERRRLHGQPETHADSQGANASALRLKLRRSASQNSNASKADAVAARASAASTTTPIETTDSTNIGLRMLKKMGWSSGEGLGKNGTGIALPIDAASSASTQRRGVGAPLSAALPQRKRRRGRR